MKFFSIFLKEFYDIALEAKKLKASKLLFSNAKVPLNYFAISQARTIKVRQMVREAVLKYPLIFGTSIERIDTRLNDLISTQSSWEKFIPILRRSEEKQLEWLSKFDKD